MKSILACPVCKNTLFLSDKQYRCVKNHTFDLAKEHYVNLLLNSSSSTGDDKQMVLARNAFLEKGYYNGIAEKLKELIESNMSTHDDVTILDAGCGEGYYLHFLDQTLKGHPHLYGFDISKKAIQLAAKRNPNVTWFVGNAFHIPVHDHSIDFFISMFAFYSVDEVKRVLKDSGSAIIFRAGKYHLIELKNILYNELSLKESSHDFGEDRIEKQNLNYKVNINSQEDIEHLLLMTPHYWKTKLENKELLKKVHSLTCTIDVDIYFLKKV